MITNLTVEPSSTSMFPGRGCKNCGALDSTVASVCSVCFPLTVNSCCLRVTVVVELSTTAPGAEGEKCRK